MDEQKSKIRNQVIRVKLSDEKFDEFGVFSDRYGLPVATLAAFVIADWMERQRMSERAQIEAVKNLTSSGFLQGLDSQLQPILEAAFKSVSLEK